MTMFMGEYYHNLDEKSRLVIPSLYRKELGNKFVITKGIEKCLYVYSNEEWQKIVNKLEELPFTKKDARTFIRAFFSGASVCEIDKSGRIVLTSNIKDYANITKECVIIGANNRCEIWDKSMWEEEITSKEDELSDIAENLFTGVNI